MIDYFLLSIQSKKEKLKEKNITNSKQEITHKSVN